MFISLEEILLISVGCPKNIWHIFWATEHYVHICKNSDLLKSDYAQCKVCFHVYKNPERLLRLEQRAISEMSGFSEFLV